MALFDEVKKFLNNIKENSDLSEKLFEIIEVPQNEIITHFPVEMDNGQYKIFKGYRVQHNNCLGPYKGGLRFWNSVNLSEVEALAFWMTLKCSLANIPYGGGKGGIKIDLNQYSEKEIERVARGFSRALADHIGPELDIPAPDMGTNSKIIDYMTDQYQKLKGRHHLGVFTGKSLNFGGSLGREYSTGKGVALCVERYIEKNKLNTNDLTYIVQGFGNVGSYTSLFLKEMGLKCLGVGDHTAYIYDPNGIDVKDLFKYNKNNKKIAGYNSQSITKDEFFKIKCDFILPCAMESQITEENVDNINCKAIFEGANGPINCYADIQLKNKGIDVLPDILCNGGGVIVSYFEWLQNIHSEYWTEEKVNEKLKIHIFNAFDNIWSQYVNNKDKSLRYYCYYTSLKKIENNLKARGLISL